MTQPEILVSKIAHDAEHVVRGKRSLLLALARYGYAANGIVYLLVGTQAAFGAILGIEDSLERITGSAWGILALGVLTLGLAAYAAWNFIQAFFDTEHAGTTIKGIIDRTGYLIVGLLYSGLAFTTWRILQGRNTGREEEEWTAALLVEPLGRFAVGLVGVIVTIVAAAQFYKAVSADFRNSLKLEEMASGERSWTLNVARFGYTARGVVGIITGIFMVVAARRVNPEETKGLAESLQVLRDQPYGPALLAVVALGLAAYGVYMIVLARYKKMIRWDRPVKA